MNTYAGKNIWIIGASSGIGRALATELSDQGATLVLSARSEDKLRNLNTDLGGHHHVLPLDVADFDACTQAAAGIPKSFPQLDSVIFMSAIYDPPAPLAEMDIDAAHNIVNINLNGALNVIHAVLPIFNKQGFGQLALCGSVAGYRGLPNGQPYSATKAAIINLAESLRAEQKHLDIKVINPGFVRTPLTDKNKFKMPIIIEAEKAAKIIARELLTNRFEIHFPKRFTIILKLLSILPSWLYFKCVPRS